MIFKSLIANNQCNEYKSLFSWQQSHTNGSVVWNIISPLSTVILTDSWFSYLSFSDCHANNFYHNQCTTFLFCLLMSLKPAWLYLKRILYMIGSKRVMVSFTIIKDKLCFKLWLSITSIVLFVEDLQSESCLLWSVR